MKFRGIYDELKRRNVIKVGTVYAITAWLIAQIVSLAADTFGAPAWVMKMVIVLLLVGFPLALIFAWAFELTPDGLKKTEDVSRTKSQATKTGRKLNRWMIGALALLVTVIIVENIWLASSAATGSSANVNHASIAVLPFRNLSNYKNNQYFSEGLSEELLNDLAQVDSLKVAGRSSSFRFKGDEQNVQNVGKQLGVRNILKGSVRKSGNRVRITVQLVNAQSGDFEWSKSFDRNLDDIFAIQKEISQKVIQQLKVKLLPKTQKQLATLPTDNVESYQIYLKANQIIATRNIDDINRAIDLYKQAIDLDPGFAKAHARLAMAYALQGDNGNVPMEQVQEQIRGQAERARLLNGDLGEAYAAIGLYYQNAGENSKAEQAFRHSLQLNPNQPNVHLWLGILYWGKGNFSSGNAQAKKAYEMDPLAPVPLNSYAISKMSEGDYKEAEKLLQKNIRLNPGFWGGYVGLSELKASAPVGRLDSGFISLHDAFRQNSSVARFISLQTLFASELGITPVVNYFYHKLENQFPESSEYILASLYYARAKGNGSIADTIIWPYLQQYGLPTYTPDVIFYPMANIAYHTGHYKRLMAAIKKRAPELFRGEPEPVTLRNYIYADILISLPQIQENNEQVRQLTGAYCRGIEQLKGRFPGTGAYASSKATCLLYQGKPEDALPYAQKYFLDDNGIWGAWTFFDNPVFKKALQRPAYQEIRNKIEVKLARQRKNVIAYLKKEGDWQESWKE